MNKGNSTIVCDVDGVLSDNSARLEALDRSNPDWVAFHDLQHEDPLRAAEAALLSLLYDGGYNVVLLTNRPEMYRAVTEEWLDRHQVRYHMLLMRKPGADYHQAKIDAVRALQAEDWDVSLCIDDDPQHCLNINDQCGVPTLYVHSGYYEGQRLDTSVYVSQDRS